MIDAEDAVIWTNDDEKTVRVLPRNDSWARTLAREDWGDPIGAHYVQWQEMSNDRRVLLMLETAIDLAMQRYPLEHVLTEFAKVTEFRALGAQSFPMCRALTKALVGKSLEPNTMGFEDLLAHYAPY